MSFLDMLQWYSIITFAFGGRRGVHQNVNACQLGGGGLCQCENKHLNVHLDFYADICNSIDTIL